MPTLIQAPAVVAAVGSKPKVIHEYVGRLNSGTNSTSVAHMKSPEGWVEPGQRPEFDEYSIVLSGTLVVQDEDGETIRVGPTQAVIARADEWVKYSTPDAGGAEYLAVCVPAFSPDTVHRDKD